MAQMLKMFHDDIQNKIASVIRSKMKKYIPFEELDKYDKELVFENIKNKYGNDFRVVVREGYDILKGIFFVDEYVSDGIFSIKLEHKEFPNFDDYYIDLSGNIYDKSSYYGYEFSKEEIEKYNLDINILDFVSFKKERMKTFEEIISGEDNEAKIIIKKNKTIQDFMNDYCDKDNYDFSKILKKFIKKFCVDEDKSKAILLSNFFFPTLIEKYRDDFCFKLDLTIYCCIDGCGFGFFDALTYYGEEFANKIIEHYMETSGNEKKTREKIKWMKKVVECYLEKRIFLGERYFDKKTQLYIIECNCIDTDGYCLAKRFVCSSSVQEFAKILNGDLVNCDLRDAPLKQEDISNYNIDDTTKLPIRFGYDKCVIEKNYSSDGFFEIIHRWYSNEKEILGHQYKFKYFCDYVYFLNGDLSNADFILCDDARGLKNVKNIKIDGIKVRSEVAKELGLEMKCASNLNDTSLKDEIETKYEIESNNYYLQERELDTDFKKWRISYITDIHLIHLLRNNNCVTEEDIDYIIRKTAKDIVDSSTSINLIGGDIASDNNYLDRFISELYETKRSSNRYFVTLGNHELWDFAGKNMNEIVDYFKDYYKSKEMYLVHNNLFYIENNNYGKEIKEITTEELKVIDEKTLREKVKGSSLIIFGGLGFAGKNEKFNANNGIYRNTLNREQEIKESEFFNDLYNKVASILYDKNVIIFTHNPKADWSGNNETIDGFVYVNGHRHRNYFYDDGITRIYADNQVGYNQKNVRLKKILIDVKFDYFSDVEDGIHAISKEEYELFYRGIQEGISVNRDFKQIYLLKKDGNYMFLMEMKSGSLDILNGASIKKAEKQSLEYYYENLTNYSNSIKMFLSKYNDYQKMLSNEIKKFGGNGTIHGCIIDIDFYNHIYINPLDAKITSYFAYSMTEKYVYKNLISLLKKECPDLYLNYQKNIDENKSNSAIVPFYNDLVISDKSTFVGDTSMYSISRIIKGLQYTTRFNIVRLWSESIIGEPSESKGKQIVNSMIYPNQLEEPKNEEADYETQKIRKRFKI